MKWQVQSGSVCGGVILSGWLRVSDGGGEAGYMHEGGHALFVLEWEGGVPIQSDWVLASDGRGESRPSRTRVCTD